MVFSLTLQAQMKSKFKEMKEEDFDSKFPPLYLGKKHGREVGT